MNVRALALGALVGFVVAFAPACSPPKCGPQNCDGCCDAKGACVKKPNNNNNTTCGSAGNTCTDCAAAASTCNPATSTCGTAGGTGGSGGGTTGGGGGTTGGGGGTCDGCQLPSGACSPRQLSATSTSNCGINNVRCVACGTGELCTDGVCGAPDSGVAGIGSACNTNADCSTIVLTARDSSLGMRPFCKKFATDLTAPMGQGYAYTGGYCSKRCGFEANSCGTGNTCSYILGDWGEAENMCFQSCARDADCRQDYFCLPYSSATAGICLPRTILKDLPDGGQTIENVDAGPGFPGEAGAACANNTECQPPADGVCLAENLDAGYVGGACTAECTASLSDDTWCGTGAVCNPNGYLSGDNFGPVVRWFCERGCGTQTDGGLVGTCRSGYVCDGTDQFAICVPHCTNSGYTCNQGQTCDPDGGLCQ